MKLYIVVKAPTSIQLEAAVESLLVQGYVCQGGVSRFEVNGISIMYQAMVYQPQLTHGNKNV